MAYVLHNRLGSSGFLVEAMLTAANVPFAYEPLKSLPNTPVRPLVQRVNPWGQVPVLVTPDGTVLTECGAILIYLVEHEPGCARGPHLFVPPDDEGNGGSKGGGGSRASAACLRWTVFLSVNAYEGILRQSYPRRYFDPFDDDDDLNSKVEESVQLAARKRTHAAFKLLEEHVLAKNKEGHKFLLGERMSPVDVYLACLYAWHNKQADLPGCTEITRRVATHEVIGPVWERNFRDRLDEK